MLDFFSVVDVAEFVSLDSSITTPLGISISTVVELLVFVACFALLGMWLEFATLPLLLERLRRRGPKGENKMDAGIPTTTPMRVNEPSSKTLPVKSAAKDTPVVEVETTPTTTTDADLATKEVAQPPQLMEKLDDCIDAFFQDEELLDDVLIEFGAGTSVIASRPAKEKSASTAPPPAAKASANLGFDKAMAQRMTRHLSRPEKKDVPHTTKVVEPAESATAKQAAAQSAGATFDKDMDDILDELF